MALAATIPPMAMAVVLIMPNATERCHVFGVGGPFCSLAPPTPAICLRLRAPSTLWGSLGGECPTMAKEMALG